MPVKRMNADADAWWQNAYSGMPHIEPSYEFVSGKDVVVPKTKIRIRSARGIFKFRCVATNVRTGSTWIDCVNLLTGEWRSFSVDRFKCVERPKRRRKRPVG